MATEESDAEAGLRLASACCVAYIHCSYGVRITKHTATTLMKALLLKPDNAGQKCADYDQLLDTYLVSEQWRRYVFTSITILYSVFLYLAIYNYFALLFGQI